MRNILLPILALLTLGACQTSGSLDLGGRGSHAILVVAEDGQTGPFVGATNDRHRCTVYRFYGER